MKVIKIGGGCLNGKHTIAHIVELIAKKCTGHIVVVSALNGITDTLIEGIDSALANEENIPEIINRIKARHKLIARHLISSKEDLRLFYKTLNRSLNKLERLYFGLNFTREITPRMRDFIVSYGERLSAILLCHVLTSRNVSASYRMPHKIGLITDGKFADATANIKKTSENFKHQLTPILERGAILFIPGFFGISKDGDITTFGRGGSDYSAAVVAAAMDCETLEVWKDVAGYMSADPKIVSGAKLIPTLSYEEAAELSYFGAKILHPRTVEPLRKNGISIAIKNTMDPDATGSLISSGTQLPRTVIKSVAHNKNIGILKVHASGVGTRMGILAQVATKLSESEINIKSVVTSQTCISILLDSDDLESGHKALKSLSPRPFRRLEKNSDMALVSIVGEGLSKKLGLAAKCFTAAAENNINIEMIAFGPSRAALYFLIREKDLGNAVNAIHGTFFSDHP